MATNDEVMERVVREEQEWLVARLHHAEHGTWLTPAECAVCIEQDAEDEPE